MASHQQRLDAARHAVEYIGARAGEAPDTPVPNCPGWTVRNAIVHIGRVGVAWKSMIEASPDDPDSRTRGYADADARGSGQSCEELTSWALAAIDALDGDPERTCYFSMAGGAGTVALWAWHAASELGIHRLDVEHAVGDSYGLTDDQALDAIDYSAHHFLPAMARAADTYPPALEAVARSADGRQQTIAFRMKEPDEEPSVTVHGEPVDLLLALWGRAHGPIEVLGDDRVFAQWRALPSTAFQFGTWD